MLYLIVSEPRESVFNMPPEQLAGFIENNVYPSLETLDRLSREKVVTGGLFAGRPGSALIVDVSSNEELNKLVASLPFAMTNKTTVTPLVSIRDGIENLHGIVDRMKGGRGR